ncbi:hypothetical protein M902_2874 [Bacteriovorax sp. BAL6_X]|uniref:hypothetical protein n=1 Tax=Bacteriovorax sp. BAL6_X TaxID=1201290 RepID=UPI000386138E|nr:hypothetical protein [Bacteriovorax sp. BAL6_X]EPZ50955.1 hypothetical protein M902_2874 [Bacteriovorax sp. BAL6_X]
MKLVMTLLSLISFLAINSNVIACDNIVSKKLERKIRADRPLQVRYLMYLTEGTELLNDRGNKLAQFNEDKLIYSAIGSEHSGWFNAAVAVNPDTCSIDYIGHFAAE